MSTTNAATFACEACGKSYRWRPDFEGKKLKCGCGNVMLVTAPALPEAPLEEAPLRAEEACPDCSSPVAPGAAICVNCGFNLQTGQKVQTEVVGGAPKAGKKKTKKGAAATAKGKPQEFKSFAQRRILADDPEEVAAKARWNDFYWPSIALGVGLLLSIVDGIWGQDSSDWKVAIVLILITALVNVIFSFAGVLVTSKLLSIGLGNFHTALLKVSAIALAPGAISSILSSKFSSGWVFGWIISVTLYFLMFYRFFDMDMGETFICSAIIWVMRTWLAYFVIAMILALIFGHSGGFGDDEDMPTRPRTKKLPNNKVKQKAPKYDDSEESLVYPINDKAMVVFFDSARDDTYHLGIGAVPA